MRKAAMAPEVPLADAQVEANYIRIRDYGANGSDNPYALRNFRPIKARSDTERRHRM